MRQDSDVSDFDCNFCLYCCEEAVRFSSSDCRLVISFVTALPTITVLPYPMRIVHSHKGWNISKIEVFRDET